MKDIVKFHNMYNPSVFAEYKIKRMRKYQLICKRGTEMGKYTSGAEIPVGLGIALEQCNAMDYFFSLPQNAQQQIIDHTHTIQSKNEMLAYVQSLVKVQ